MELKQFYLPQGCLSTFKMNSFKAVVQIFFIKANTTLEKTSLKKGMFQINLCSGRYDVIIILPKAGFIYNPFYNAFSNLSAKSATTGNLYMLPL